MILLPAESLGRKHNHTESQKEAIVLPVVVLERSKRLQTVIAEAKYNGQSRPADLTVSGLIHILGESLST